MGCWICRRIGKWRECSTVSSAKGGKSARNIGIDLADLHKMAPGAGDGTTFLVIQAISKKSILRLTNISLLKKRRGKSAQAHSLELLFTNPLIFHRSHVISVEVSPHASLYLATTRTGRECSRSVDAQHATSTKHGHGELDAALRVTTTSVLLKSSWLVWAAVWGSGFGAQVVGASGRQPGPLGCGTSVRAELSASASPPLRPASGRVFPGLLPTIHSHV